MTFPQNPSAMDKLKTAWNENPIAVIGVASVALTAIGKLIDAVGAYQGRQAYKKDVNRRVKEKRKSQ